MRRRRSKARRPAPQNSQSQNGSPAKRRASRQRSKLEKETGTVNDRIFEVMPNYGTVETSKDLPPSRLDRNTRPLLPQASLIISLSPSTDCSPRSTNANNSPEILGSRMGLLRQTLRRFLRRQQHWNVHDDGDLPVDTP